MFEIVSAGGWLMLPLILCSVLAAAITAERLWALQRKRVLPLELSAKVAVWVEKRQLDERHVRALEENSPLGRILAAGVARRNAPRDLIKEGIEDTGRQVVHDLERFLNTLGTIAAITPLLGLLGTVVGMVKVFAAITLQGVGNPEVLAGGISEALITTAAGLSIAIPTLVAYRYLRRQVDTLVLEMEQEAIKVVDALSRTDGEVGAGPDAPAAGANAAPSNQGSRAPRSRGERREGAQTTPSKGSAPNKGSGSRATTPRRVSS